MTQPTQTPASNATATITAASLTVGDVVAQNEFTFERSTLVKYAGASGDFNPIHYRDDVAQSVGLPGVLAHGMLTMGTAVQPVVDWLGGDSGRVLDYQVRFTRPVPVDGTDGALVTVVAKVGAIDETPLTEAPAGFARIDLTVSFNGETVLGKAQVRVRLSPAA
jgi:acyl dehydratase